MEYKRLFNSLILCIVSLAVKSQYNVTTYAGNGSPGFTNGNVSSATFTQPFGICMDKSGNLFIAEQGNNCVRKISPAGIVSTYAGTGIAGYQDGPASMAQFDSPSDLCTDDSGNVYVSDFLNNRIRKITTNGTVMTIAGSGTEGYLDGTALTAQFDCPRGICVDKQGNVYVGDSWNHRIRKIDKKGDVITYAGGGNSKGPGSSGAYLDANDTTAKFYTPTGLSIDKSGNIYVADTYNHRIRKISTSRIVTTVCGSGPTGPGYGGYSDGNALSAIFNTPTGIYSDSLGNLIIGDTFGNRVRKADVSGNVSTIAGNGSPGFINGAGGTSEFNFARGVVGSPDNDKIYVVDYNNNAIRLITPGNNNTIENSFIKNDLKIWPNPFTNEIAVELSNADYFAIYDMNGNKIREKKCDDKCGVKIDLSETPAGAYLMTVVIQNNTHTVKIIKQ